MKPPREQVRCEFNLYPFLGFICNCLSYFTTAKISFTSILTRHCRYKMLCCILAERRPFVSYFPSHLTATWMHSCLCSVRRQKGLLHGRELIFVLICFIIFLQRARHSGVRCTQTWWFLHCGQSWCQHDARGFGHAPSNSERSHDHRTRRMAGVSRVGESYISSLHLVSYMKSYMKRSF